MALFLLRFCSFGFNTQHSLVLIMSWSVTNNVSVVETTTLPFTSNRFVISYKCWSEIFSIFRWPDGMQDLTCPKAERLAEVRWRGRNQFNLDIAARWLLRHVIRPAWDGRLDVDHRHPASRTWLSEKIISRYVHSYDNQLQVSSHFGLFVLFITKSNM